MYDAILSYLTKTELMKLKFYTQFIAYFITLFFLWVLLSGCSPGSPNQPNENSQERKAELIPSSFYDPNNPSTHILPNSIFIDHNNDKWIGFAQPQNTTGGVIRFNGTNWEKFLSSNTPVPFQYVTKVHTEDGEGGVYFTTQNTNETNRYLIRFKNGQWSYWNIYDVMAHPDKIFYNSIDNNLYFYSGRSIKKISPTADFSNSGNYTAVNTDGISHSNMMDCTMTGSNFYIVGDVNSLKASIATTPVVLTPIAGGLSFRKVAASKDGNVYSLVRPDKIMHLNENTWEVYPFLTGNTESLIANLAVDNFNQVFIFDAVANKGIGKITNGKVAYYTINGQSIQFNPLSPSMMIDNNNVKWIAVSEGLVKIID